VTIGDILLLLGIFFSVLVRCTKTNLATLTWSRFYESATAVICIQNLHVKGQTNVRDCWLLILF
jgi:hypothetical protein